MPSFKELSISLEPRRLLITGRRETKKEETKGKAIYAEIGANEIMRGVDLRVEVETEKHCCHAQERHPRTESAQSNKNEKYQRGNQGGVGSPISWRTAGQVLARRFKFHDVDWVINPDL